MIKVISYNILSNEWSFYDTNRPSTLKLKNRYEFVDSEVLVWENRLPKIIDKVKDYDVICLQEVDLVNVNQITSLLPEHEAYHHVIWKDEYKGNKEIYKRTNTIGNMTLWKNLKCIEKKSTSCALMTRFEEFTIINLHLRGGKDYENQRISQLKSCLKLATDKVCLCGDFNDEFQGELKNIINEYTLLPNQMTCDCYQSLFKIHKFHSFDHVISKNLSITQELCPQPQPIPSETEPSDHYSLIFTIHLDTDSSDESVNEMKRKYPHLFQLTF